MLAPCSKIKDDDAPRARQVVHNHEVVSTVPAHREPRGVVFMLHGCLQLVTEWGFQSELCPDCHGAAQPAADVTALVQAVR